METGRSFKWLVVVTLFISLVMAPFSAPVKAETREEPATSEQQPTSNDEVIEEEAAPESVGEEPAQPHEPVIEASESEPAPVDIIEEPEVTESTIEASVANEQPQVSQPDQAVKQTSAEAVGKITVQYKESGSGKVLEADKVIADENAKIGDPFSVTAAAIANYLAKEVEVDGVKQDGLAVTGKYTATAQTIVYYYVANQTAIFVKDITLHTGDKWEAADSFVSAINEEGNALTLADLTVTGYVSTDKAGSYKVTYHYGGIEAIATITVVQSQALIDAKNSVLYIGDKWEPADNFIGATDKDGKVIPFEQISIEGTVDTTKAGEYSIKYITADNVSITITVTVKADESVFELKDSTLYLGDKWQAEDNFVKAFDKDGKEIAFASIKVEGTVDTAKEGSYQVTYTAPDGQTATITVTVVVNQATLVVKDSSLYVGDKWEAADNFVSATDKDGNVIAFEKVTVTGEVDLTKEGLYKVTYATATGETAIASITVIANKASIEANNSIVYVGDKWQAEDNFVSATNKEGEAITWPHISVQGTVDTTKVGDYPITYITPDGIKLTIIVTVKVDAFKFEVKDSVIYTGDVWLPVDNIVTALDKEGEVIPMTDIKVDGTVNSLEKGVYTVTYTIGELSETATITVKKNRSSLNVQNTFLFVGDEWDLADNFVSATAKDGSVLTLDQIDVEGSVDTTKIGSNKLIFTSPAGLTRTVFVTVFASGEVNLASLEAHDSTLVVGDEWQAMDNFDYATDSEGKAIAFADINVSGAVDSAVVGAYPITYESPTGLQKTITVTVIEEAGESEPQPEPGPTPTPPKGPNGGQNKPSDSKKKLPKTGDAASTAPLAMGMFATALALYVVSRRKKS
ncbi:bacterial Ig-like domain-containing protein [Brochothrix campestris]|uniref:Cell wall anchor domain-containing protein n=1 Tax=Brochothrix campestris FSL F6-1037 TaxID=1265861 RepID=W7D245_9LIST|nr:bacterial Ig-like domain-containing protein [Brochothrix campestris]EUJ39353.1 cell wall anchor domain-containing protein [Brochothrix campestris FSL F6-1037]